MQPGRSTQYDIGTDNYNGLTDIPVYIALMNEKNGGCLYFPTNLK
jgi:HKD family nuclease